MIKYKSIDIEKKFKKVVDFLASYNTLISNNSDLAVLKNKDKGNIFTVSKNYDFVNFENFNDLEVPTINITVNNDNHVVYNKIYYEINADLYVDNTTDFKKVFSKQKEIYYSKLNSLETL